MRDDGYRTFAGGRQIEDRGNGASSAGGIETLPRFGLAELAGTSGQLWVSYVTAAAAGTIGKLMVASSSAAAASVTLARLALFTAAADGSITKVAQTASDTTIGGSAYTPYERALATAGGFPATYRVSRGRRYALGYLIVGTTPGSIQGAFVLDGASPPVPARIIAGQTDIANSYDGGDLGAHWAMAYMRGMPA